MVSSRSEIEIGIEMAKGMGLGTGNVNGNGNGISALHRYENICGGASSNLMHTQAEARAHTGTQAFEFQLEFLLVFSLGQLSSFH